MSTSGVLMLCLQCKVGIPVQVELVNPNFEVTKCDGCKRKKPCQAFKLVGRGKKDGET